MPSAEARWVLPTPGGPRKTIFSPFSRSQLINLALADRGLKAEIKALQCFLDGKSGHLHLLLIGASAFVERLFSKDMVEYLHDVELILYARSR